MRFTGRLDGDPEIRNDAYVVLWTQEEGGLVIQDIAESQSDGLFAFLLKEDKNYYLGAFKDLNNNTQFDDGDPVWYYGDIAPTPIPDRKRGATSSKSVVIERKYDYPLETLAALKLNRGQRELLELSTKQSVEIILGDVTTLDDPRFSMEIGDQGLWEPTQFIRQNGIGVFFLEPYSAEKLPIVFVSGASGTPRNWSWILENIDSDKFQAWIYYYPSGMRLGESVNILHRLIGGLQDKYNFPEIGLAAHSMGGLVARRYAQIATNEEHVDYIKGIVTFSTPWEGHQMAKLGVDHAPEAVPSWLDLQPNSSFIETSLDDKMVVPHLLMYGNAASKSMFLPDENDGTTSVESMTAERAIVSAEKVLQFEDTHMSILQQAKALQAMEDFLSH